MPGATWRIASRNNNWLCLPTAHRPMRCTPISCVLFLVRLRADADLTSAGPARALKNLARAQCFTIRLILLLKVGKRGQNQRAQGLRVGVMPSLVIRCYTQCLRLFRQVPDPAPGIPDYAVSLYMAGLPGVMQDGNADPGSVAPGI